MPKIIDVYTLHQVIGEGVYGKVYRAVNREDQKQYAIKMIPISYFYENKKLQEQTTNSINILNYFKTNEHIIRYYDMLKTRNNFYFIYEYCNGGSLYDLIKNQKPLSQKRVLQIFAQILKAFQSINQAKMMHKDLKTDNILFHNGIVKIGDISFSKESLLKNMNQCMLGCPSYMAPEVLKGQVYSSKADIWSLGCVLYEMLFNQLPFQSNSLPKLIFILENSNFFIPKQVSPLIKQLLTKILIKDTDKRISWDELSQMSVKIDKQIKDSKYYINSFENLTSFKQLKPQRQAVQNQKKLKQNQRNEKELLNTIKQTVVLKKQVRMPFQHYKVLEGINLSKDLFESKIANHMGLACIVLKKTIQILYEQIKKCDDQQIKYILQLQLSELKKNHDLLIKKMFNYELKQIQDWKKYLRGRYFGQQQSVSLWLRLICYLQKKQLPNQQLTNQAISKYIRSILY